MKKQAKEEALFILGAVIFGIVAGALMMAYMHNANEAMQLLNSSL